MADALISRSQPFVFITGPSFPPANTPISVLIVSGSSSGSVSGITGTGSPEGAQTATPGITYYDSSTGQFWVKATGSGNTGWVLLIS